MPAWCFAARCLIASRRSTASAGTAICGPSARQLLAQRAMPMPAVADRRGQVAEVELLPQFFLLFFQARQLALEHAAVAGQAGVGLGVRLLLLDLPADLLPLVHELRDLARARRAGRGSGSASFPVPA